MTASQDIAKRDLSSMGGEKNAQNNAAEEVRDVESDAESMDTKAGSIWTIMGSVSGACIYRTVVDDCINDHRQWRTIQMDINRA